MARVPSHHQRALAHLDKGRVPEALQALRASVLAHESQAERSVLTGLAIHDAQGDAKGAAAWLTWAAGSHLPGDRWWAVLAEREMAQGHFDAAIAAADQALAVNPANALAAINRACWLAGRWGDCVETRQMMEAWAARFLVPPGPVPSARSLLSADALSGRRLRVGYVSGDLKNHSVRYFIEGVLRHHDRRQFEIHAFMTLPEDEVSGFLRPWVDHWHSVQALDDDALVERIRSLAIDVLVDLSGHTEGERLAVFARRAAPVQVTWFGYMQTLGLPTMDWRLTDHTTSPPGSEAYYTEALWRLECMASYWPPAHTEALFESPWHTNGYVTMVCLNHSRKISDDALQAWSAILQREPDCGLLLISSETEPASDHGLQQRLRQFDLPADRTLVMGRQTMAAFLRLASIADFALDPFPISGGTTTLHALWTGLPTLALDLTAHGGMQGAAAAIQRGCGLEAAVVDSVDAYVDTACRWIREPAHVDALRSRCRPGLQASAMMQHADRTREVEAAYRGMLQALDASP